MKGKNITSKQMKVKQNTFYAHELISENIKN